MDRILTVRETMLMQLNKAQVKITQGVGGSKSKKKTIEKYKKVKSVIVEARLRANKQICTNRLEELYNKILDIYKK